jgi:hypothetical protein
VFNDDNNFVGTAGSYVDDSTMAVVVTVDHCYDADNNHENVAALDAADVDGIYVVATKLYYVPDDNCEGVAIETAVDVDVRRKMLHNDDVVDVWKKKSIHDIVVLVRMVSVLFLVNLPLMLMPKRGRILMIIICDSSIEWIIARYF